MIHRGSFQVAYNGSRPDPMPGVPPLGYLGHGAVFDQDAEVVESDDVALVEELVSEVKIEDVELVEPVEPVPVEKTVTRPRKPGVARRKV